MDDRRNGVILITKKEVSEWILLFCIFDSAHQKYMLDECVENCNNNYTAIVKMR